MKGTIVRVLGDKMFGFIKGEDGQDYFFHQSALKNLEFNQRLEGISVEFEETEGPKGLRAEDVYAE